MLEFANCCQHRGASVVFFGAAASHPEQELLVALLLAASHLSIYLDRWKEWNVFSVRKHRNVISLPGLCAGHEEPLPAHAAADICDAMLHGLEACHARGVTHLDLKPSVIWEVAQPAGVVVKILDFGLARLANLGVLPADARQFFRPGAGGSSEANPQLQFDNVLAAEMPVAPPKATDGLQAWMPLAPFAQLSGAGSCWYMSPSRWCGFAVASRTAAEQPTMRLCNVPSGNLWLERGPTQDIIGVSKITAASSAIQGAAVAMQLPEGTYFEVQLRKVWPSPMLPPGSDLAVGPAIGFTRIPPQSGFSALTSKAKDWPLSWVLGYDGRFFHDGAEAAPVLNSPHFAVHEFRRHRDAKLAAAGSGDTDIEWPTGPLGWSFVELLRLCRAAAGGYSRAVGKEVRRACGLCEWPSGLVRECCRPL